MKSNAYWDDRVNQILADNHQSSTQQILRINQAYDKALKDVQQDIDKIFIKYAKGHNLTLAQAKKFLNGKIPNNVDELRLRLAQTSNEELKKSILAELNKNAYRARITRLEALKQSLNVNYRLLADKELKLSKQAYINTIKSSYYRNIYEFQRGTNLAFDIANINTRAVNMILNTEWLGSNYSSRVWGNTQNLASNLDSIITRGFLSGKALSTIAKELEKQTQYGKFAAERLVRTETTFFNNQAALEGYKEVGIEKYVFVATLDMRTSKVCQQHDRKVYLISEQVPGENCPPLHPFCRSTIRSYINDEILNRAQRRARNPITGKNELVGNMSYEEWYKKYAMGASYNELSNINPEYSVNMRKINTNKYTRKFEGIGKNGKVDIRVRNEAINMLKHRNGSEFEDIVYLDARTGKVIYSKIDSTKPFGINLGDDKKLIDSYGGELIAIHNHPGSTRPSIGDIITMNKSPNVVKSVIVGHNGNVHIISGMNKQVDIEKMFSEEYTYIKDIYGDKDLALVKATDSVYSKGIFEHVER